MSLAKRFWDPVTPAEGKNDFYAGFQVHLMPGGNVDGFDSSPGSHDHTHGSTLFNQWDPASLFTAWFGLRSIKAALGASDRGEVQEQAEMSSDPHRSRVGDPLTIDQNQIWLPRQFGESLHQDWCFPESEKTGNVGKGGPPLSLGTFQEGQIGIREEKEGGVYPIIRTAVRDIPGADFFPRNFGGRED